MVVVASSDHPIFSGPIEMMDLCRYRWVLGASTVTARRWIDHAFTSNQLPAPEVQVETNSISLLPRLIAQTKLLSFVARETLEHGHGMSRLREVPLTQTTMKRSVGISIRAEGYISPAAAALVELLRENGYRFFRED
ncbi:pca operon transcription factor PcaQ [compost metagenome]